MRLRMICQSWKVMFQAEYSSGQPLRMLVDLRGSVEHALGRGKAADAAKEKAQARPAAASPAPATKSVAAPSAKAAVTASAAPATASKAGLAKPKAKAAAANSAPAEFEVSADTGWDADAATDAGKKR